MNTLFICGSQKNMPPQGIYNALSLNVNAPAIRGWVLSVHSEDRGWGGGRSPTWLQRGEGHRKGQRPTASFPGAMHSVLYDCPMKNLLRTE